MSIREQIQNHLDKHPTVTFNELKKKLPHVKHNTLKAYFYKLKQVMKKPEKETSASPVLSTRKRVSAYLKENPDASLHDLSTAIKNVKSTTLSSYFYTLKGKSNSKSKEDQKSEGSLQSRGFAFLDENRDSKLSDLQKKFPDANYNSLSAIRSRWRKAQETTLSIKPKTATDTNNPDLPDLPATLRKTIAAQEKIITAQEKAIISNSRERSKDKFIELAGLTFDEIKRVAASYIQGIKNLPSKLRKK